MFVYGSDMAKDCCASNFERSVFRYDRVVGAAKDFDCIKFSASGDSPIYRQFNLDKKKPAMLLLDAEGGLIHKQQKCVDPGKYFSVVRDAIELNRRRLDFRQKYMVQHEEIRNLIDGGQFDKALKQIDRALRKRELMMGDVERMISGAQQEVEQSGRAMFERAAELQDGKSYLAALDLFKQVKQEFARIDDLSDRAEARVRELTKTLRDLGVTTR